MKDKIIKRLKDVFSQFVAYTDDTDKILHCAVGFTIAFYFGLYNQFLGLSLAILAGIGKEVYDRLSKKGEPEAWDLVFTTLGGLFGILNIWACRYFIILIIKYI